MDIISKQEARQQLEKNIMDEYMPKLNELIRDAVAKKAASVEWEL